MNVTVNVSEWNKDPKSVNSICNLFNIEGKEKTPVRVNTTIISSDLKQSYMFSNQSIGNSSLLQTHEDLNGYFLVCHHVFHILAREVTDTNHLLTLRTETGLVPLYIRHDDYDNEIIISMCLVIKNEYCNSKYLKGQFFDEEFSEANVVTPTPKNCKIDSESKNKEE